MKSVLTIGYGDRSVHELVDLLKRESVQFLIDVRSSPYSRFKPDFNREALKRAIESHRLHYLFMGDCLGGRPSESEGYDADGRVDYQSVAESQGFRSGIERLLVAHNKGLSIALMCSELRPEQCHRSKLIGKHLEQVGISVLHVDENGSRICQSELIARITGGQEDLFGNSAQTSRSRGKYKPTSA